jgi:hypothetical protein
VGAATGTARPARLPTPRNDSRFRLAAAAEALAVFAICQLYLWRLSQTHRRSWPLILILMLFSICWRRETPARLGLLITRGLGAARWVAAGVLFGAAPVLIWGWRLGQVSLMRPDSWAVTQFTSYLCWCVLQQFALQSYMHNRLMDAVPNRHFTSVAVGVIFASLHLPNPVLTIATLPGGVAMGEVFARHRNIWLLALGQAIVATALLVAFPDTWHHRLRVGPGFDRWAP